MSADEESFIVLEETPSMLQFSLLDSLTLNSQGDTLESADTTKSSININGSVINGSVVNGSASTDHPSRSQEPSFQFGNQMKSTESDLSFASLNAESISSTMTQNEVKSRTPPKTTLAQSFLLGDINCDKMKSYFPSLSNSNQTDDIQVLIQERNDLKDALQRTNATMRQQYSMVNNWQNSVRELKETHNQELNKFRNINDELFQQNHDLQSKVTELQHLAELSSGARIKAEKERWDKQNEEKRELEKEIHSLKSELANSIASNVELDEVNRETTVKLTAIQELYKNSTVEIANLKAHNERLQRELEQAKSSINELRESSKLIQAQCEVYRNDFELERKQREEMASEREQMIADIKMLKKRNLALVDEAHTYYTETSAMSLTSNASTDNNYEAQTFTCPLCSQTYERLNELESHVQSCLERNGQ